MDFLLMAWVKKFVASAVAGAGGGVVPKVVDGLPDIGESGVLYLVSNSSSAAKATTPIYNYYDEYLWINNKWEQIGSTEIPLDEFATVDELNSAIEDAINELVASGELKGEKGDKGDKGDNGADGADGQTPYIKDGYWWIGETNTGIKAEGSDGAQGEKGDKGDKGDNGADGADGKTPVKGVDYFTDADKAELVEDVLEALPTYDGTVRL